MGVKTDCVSKQDIIDAMTPMEPWKVGKIRVIYEIGSDFLLIVSSDAISAFDCVLPPLIPYKGKVLNGLSVFWFGRTKSVCTNHLVTANVESYPTNIYEHIELLAGRSMLVKRVDRLDIECVVRAYLSGSAWKAYKDNSSICGIKLPPGLRESDKLPETIFTPTSKAESGHDIELTYSAAKKLIGHVSDIRDISIKLLELANEEAVAKGIIVADTKFEFGLCGDEVMLIDEALTPDSSRFWSMEDYEPGRPQRSFDKQYVRDYLLEAGWDKESAPPELPPDVVAKTSEKYLEAYRRITGKDLS